MNFILFICVSASVPAIAFILRLIPKYKTNIQRSCSDILSTNELSFATKYILLRIQQKKFRNTFDTHIGGFWKGSINIIISVEWLDHTVSLIYEGNVTLLTQIEATFLHNSRPLLSMFDDSIDFSYLSSNHFLIGDIVTSLPEPYTSI